MLHMNIEKFIFLCLEEVNQPTTNKTINFRFLSDTTLAIQMRIMAIKKNVAIHLLTSLISKDLLETSFIAFISSFIFGDRFMDLLVFPNGIQLFHVSNDRTKLSSLKKISELKKE